MNTYTLESFISFCDDMQITTEASTFQNIKAAIVKAFAKLINLIENKVKQMKDSNIKSTLLKLLSRAKTGLSKSKSLNESDPEKAKELQNEAKSINEELKKSVNNSGNGDNNNEKISPSARDAAEKHSKSGAASVIYTLAHGDPAFKTGKVEFYFKWFAENGIDWDNSWDEAKNEDFEDTPSGLLKKLSECKSENEIEKLWAYVASSFIDNPCKQRLEVLKKIGIKLKSTN